MDILLEKLNQPDLREVGQRPSKLQTAMVMGALITGLVFAGNWAFPLAADMFASSRKLVVELQQPDKPMYFPTSSSAQSS
ncbi:hypothetical protein IPL85_03920 [Candidatus Saccharibacteria bacterium]|nr:MAG: hypothetical protein IPL85_03920 [Candidatus Saccharibacteria bacterium]